MSTTLKLRGGSTAEHSTFTGEAREVTVDTQKNTVVVHDGSTVGGHPLLKVSDIGTASTANIGTDTGEVIGTDEAKEYFDLNFEPSVKPTISSDFSRNDHKLYEQYGLEPKTITQMYDVVRASTATYVDATGKIRTAGVNEPRIDYSSGQGRLLVEEARTNLLTWSEDFSNAAWVKTRSTTSSSNLWIPDSSDSNPLLGSDAAMVSGSTYTLRTQVKLIGDPNVVRYLTFGFRNDHFGGGITTTTYGCIDLTNGSFLAPSYPNVYTVKTLPDGYIEIITTAVATVSTNTVSNYFGINSSFSIGRDSNAVGDGVSGVDIRFIQLEQASTPSSYIPTEASAVTRAADNVSRVLGDEFNPFEVTWTFEGRLISGTNNQSIIALHSLTNMTTGASRAYTIFWDKNGQRIRARVYDADNTPNSVTITDDASYASGDYVKIAAAYSKQDQELRMSINGSIIGVVSYNVTSGMSAITTQLICSGFRDLWDQGETSSEVAKVKYFPKALSLSELQEITKL